MMYSEVVPPSVCAWFTSAPAASSSFTISVPQNSPASSAARSSRDPVSSLRRRGSRAVLSCGVFSFGRIIGKKHRFERPCLRCAATVRRGAASPSSMRPPLAGSGARCGTVCGTRSRPAREGVGCERPCAPSSPTVAWRRRGAAPWEHAAEEGGMTRPSPSSRRGGRIDRGRSCAPLELCAHASHLRRPPPLSRVCLLRQHFIMKEAST